VPRAALDASAGAVPEPHRAVATGRGEQAGGQHRHPEHRGAVGLQACHRGTWGSVGSGLSAAQRGGLVGGDAPADSSI